DDMEPRQAVVSDFAVLQGLGNDADSRRAGAQNRVGHDAHQSDVPTTVYEFEPALGDERADLGGNAGILSPSASARPAEHAHPFQTPLASLTARRIAWANWLGRKMPWRRRGGRPSARTTTDPTPNTRRNRHAQHSTAITSVNGTGGVGR